MRKSPYLRILASIVLVAYSWSVTGYDMRARQTGEPQGRLMAGVSFASAALDDFEKVYALASSRYRTEGPHAFVDALPHITNKADRQKILKSLGKLPELAQIERCGADCLLIEADGQSVKLQVGDLLAGRFSVGDVEHSVDWKRDTFDSISAKIEKGLGTQLALQSTAIENRSPLSLWAKRVCNIFIPEAHAGIGKAIVIALIVVAAAAAVWYLGKKLVDYSSKKASKVINEGNELLGNANQAARDRIKQAENAGQNLIDSAGERAETIVNDAAAQGRAVVDGAQGVVNNAQTAADNAVSNASSAAGLSH